DTTKRFIWLGVQDVEDCRDEKRMAGLLPVIAPLERTFRVDQDVGYVLGIPHLLRSATHFQQRVVLRGPLVGWVEQEAMREARPKAGSQLPVLTFDVVNDSAMWPSEKRGDDQSNALARPCWRERHDVLWASVAQIVVAKEPE